MGALKPPRLKVLRDKFSNVVQTFEKFEVSIKLWLGGQVQSIFSALPITLTTIILKGLFIKNSTKVSLHKEFTV